MLRLLAAIYRWLARPVLFRLDAERAHACAALALQLLQRARPLAALLGSPPSLPVETMGLRFDSPVGVAAGFDKRGELVDGLGALGFGFVEVGTVTARAQPGNPKPRLFRLPDDAALLNRLGFNNPGAAAVAARLAARARAATSSRRLVVGVNIGKSRSATLDDAPADYAESARLLAPHADYLVLNVSSPNTPNLRSLQSLTALRAIVSAVRRELAPLPRRVPLLVKLAPDLDDAALDALADLAVALALDGIVATNTTTSREGLRTPATTVSRLGEGGLSGPPLRARSLAVVRRLRARAGPSLTLVACGGIASPEDARAALAAGASLVQLYTALVYVGPDIAHRLVDGLRPPAA